MKKKISLKDVAGHVGVSTALVSYVMNGKEKQGRVSQKMAERIRKAAARLHYQPNLVAKSLKSGKTNTIGLVVADISNSFFSGIARVIEDEASKLGYVVIFGSSDEDAEKQNGLITAFLNRQVDALIVAPATGTEQQIAMLKKKRVPVVLVDRYFTDLDADAVHINNYQAAYDAVNHFIVNGRKKIALVAYNNPLPHMQQRRKGYVAALKANGIKPKKEWLIQASYTRIDQDVQGGLSALLEPVRVDAVLFATNSLAVAGLKKIVECGILIPEQLAVISFDENDVFDFFYSPITYVRQPIAAIGREAVLHAVDRILHTHKRSQEKTMMAELVVRKSSGA